jgi:hypothetical protein
LPAAELLIEISFQGHTKVWYLLCRKRWLEPMPDFEWDVAKERANRAKHGVAFELAQHASLDPLRVIAADIDHTAVSSATSASAGSKAAS